MDHGQLTTKALTVIPWFRRFLFKFFLLGGKNKAGVVKFNMEL